MNFELTQVKTKTHRNWCSLDHVWWTVHAFGCYAFLWWRFTCSWECACSSVPLLNKQFTVGPLNTRNQTNIRFSSYPVSHWSSALKKHSTSSHVNKNYGAQSVLSVGSYSSFLNDRLLGWWLRRSDFWIYLGMCLLNPFFLVLVLEQVHRIYSDFFPVVVTFLRQIPFIGTALSLPYVRDVSRIRTWFQNIHCRLPSLPCLLSLLTELPVHGHLQYNLFANNLLPYFQTHKKNKQFLTFRE